jgi:hypothetical protein
VQHRSKTKNVGTLPPLSSLDLLTIRVVYLIEYPKSGLGVFAGDTANGEQQARRIVGLLKRGTKAAAPFFKWMADSAIQESKVNIRNVARILFERYVYFRDHFAKNLVEAQENKKEYDVLQNQLELPMGVYSLKASQNTSPSELIAMFTFPWARMSQNSNWLALATIDSFFAWTEHIFIHLAILQGHIVTGQEVTRLAEAEWSVKFKCALNISAERR